MSSFQQYEQIKCPHCGEEIDEYFFMVGKLDKAMRDLKSGVLSFEVVTNCIKCGKSIYGVLWLVELGSSSKLNAIKGNTLIIIDKGIIITSRLGNFFKAYECA
jgi:hypothetical protein